MLMDRQYIKNRVIPYLFISPSFIFLSITTLYPILYVFKLSLTNWKLINIAEYIGFRNFIAFFSDSTSYRIVLVTFGFLFGDLIFTIIPGFFIALVLNQKIKLRGILRAISLVPWALSAVIAGVIWKWLMEPDLGILIYYLNLFNLDLDFFTDPLLALLMIIIVDSWRGIGYAAVFILAGLQSIDPEIIESSRVDGANAFKRFFYLTIPLLAPTILIIIILLTIHALNTVDVVLIMTGGGPNRMTETIAFHMYKEGVSYFNIGYGAAVGVILLTVNILLAVIYFKTIRVK